MRYKFIIDGFLDSKLKKHDLKVILSKLMHFPEFEKMAYTVEVKEVKDEPHV